MGSLTVAVKSKRIARSKESIREENELIILTAAEKVFAKHGLKGSTTKQIADMARLPKSNICLLYTSPSPRDATLSRMPSSA